MYLWISVLLYFIAAICLFFGIGNLFSMTIKMILWAASQTVAAVRGRSTGDVTVSGTLVIILTVLGLISSAAATAFLTAWLLSAG